METWFLAIVIGTVLGVMGYLLASKDKKQGEEMTTMRIQMKEEMETAFKLCHKNKDDLAAFQLRVAENHYPKNELDKRFEQLNDTITKGFTGLSTDIKGLVKEMNDHLKEHRSGGQ